MLKLNQTLLPKLLKVLKDAAAARQGPSATTGKPVRAGRVAPTTFQADAPSSPPCNLGGDTPSPGLGDGGAEWSSVPSIRVRAGVDMAAALNKHLDAARSAPSPSGTNAASVSTSQFLASANKRKTTVSAEETAALNNYSRAEGASTSATVVTSLAATFPRLPISGQRAWSRTTTELPMS